MRTHTIMLSYRPVSGTKYVTMIGALLWLLVVVGTSSVTAQEGQSCKWDDGNCFDDPHMKPMTVDLGNGQDTFWAYVPPDVSTFYQKDPGSKSAVKPRFIGQFAKFVNLSPKVIRIYWDAGKDQDELYIAEVVAFNAAGTACSPGHKFLVREKGNEGSLLDEFVVIPETSIYVYDPFKEDPDGLIKLNKGEMELYNLQKNNIEFGKKYLEFTGHEWLSLYPRRHPPRHYMWPADYFGQEHIVETPETHIVSIPPKHKMGTIVVGSDQVNPQKFQEYRSGESMNMTLTVLSCSPRVFEIKNFLSKTEVDHIMELATGMTLHTSTTKAGVDGEAREDKATRTSKNTWVKRERSPIVDIVYRRAAALLNVDEALMRTRNVNERPDFASKSSMAEQLQLVHYDVGQQYTPHHDFALPSIIEGQPMRFATILLYLNEGMGGGETAFPRWVNADTGNQLIVKPEIGKAVLFYSLLPDGNMDERSQHTALPVTAGEKWLTNLWFWDPEMKY